MAAVDAEVLGTVVLVEGYACGGCGGLESDTDEHQGLVGLVPCHLDGIVDGIDDPDIRSLGFGLEEGTNGGRDPHQVPEGRDGDWR